VSINFQASK